MTIVPAIDILGGKCVRLTRGDYSTGKVYCENPLEMAVRFSEYGLKRLHLVDLDGAGSDHIINRNVLRQICEETDLIVDFGGGIKSDADIEAAFEAGASMVTAGSIAVSNPDLVCGWIERYGAQCLILGADARNGKIAVKGWKEDSDISLSDFVEKYTGFGINRVICTDINLDGTLQGPATELYKSLLTKFPKLLLTASGGVSSVKDLSDLRDAGLDSAIVGKAFYEGRITLEQMAELNEQ